MTTFDYDRLDIATERTVTFGGIKGLPERSRDRGRSEAAYRPNYLSMRFHDTADGYFSVFIEISGPGIRKDGSDSKNIVQERFSWRLEEVPQWAWALLHSHGELPAELRKKITRLSTIDPFKEWPAE